MRREIAGSAVRSVARSFGRQRWRRQIGRNSVACRPHLLIFFLPVRRLDASAITPSPSSSLSIRLRPHRGPRSVRPVRSVPTASHRRPSTAKIIIEHRAARRRRRRCRGGRWMTMNESRPPGRSSLYGTTTTGRPAGVMTGGR